MLRRRQRQGWLSRLLAAVRRWAQSLPVRLLAAATSDPQATLSGACPCNQAGTGFWQTANQNKQMCLSTAAGHVQQTSKAVAMLMVQR